MLILSTVSVFVAILALILYFAIPAHRMLWLVFLLCGLLTALFFYGAETMKVGKRPASERVN
jgi:uncharacterized membrane protein YbhN (UPF0104 family)